jgi:hypothetical protein
MTFIQQQKDLIINCLPLYVITALLMAYVKRLKVKQYHYRPGQALRGFQQLEDPRFQDNRHMKVVKVVSPRHRPPLLPRKYSWYSILLEAKLI